MDEPMVSVIVTAFNVERFVAAAVDSALAQTYPTVEVIVVDDGSTDGTGEILHSYGDRISLIEQPNAGVGAARNRAVERATGAVVGILDGDDVWLPTRVERCMELLESHPEVGFVTTDALIIDEDGAPTGSRYTDLVPFPTGGFPHEIVRRNFVFVGAFIKRSALDQVGEFDTRRPMGADDYDMWLRLILAGWSPAIVDEPLALYRERRDSITRRDERLADARYMILEDRLPEYWDRGIHPPAGRASEISRRAWSRGDRRVALRFLRAALHDPNRTRASALLLYAKIALAHRSRRGPLRHVRRAVKQRRIGERSA